MNVPNRTKTLNELDPPAWGDPVYNSHLVRTCHRLRDKPIGEFEVEDLRIMIGQNIGLEWLVPLALEALENDPLVAGDYYRGDLLTSVLTIEPVFWAQRKYLHARVQQVIDQLPYVDERILSKAMKAFQSG